MFINEHSKPEQIDIQLWYIIFYKNRSSKCKQRVCLYSTVTDFTTYLLICLIIKYQFNVKHFPLKINRRKIELNQQWHDFVSK